MRRFHHILLPALACLALSCREQTHPESDPAAVSLVPTPMAGEVATALESAGDNSAELERAIRDAHGDERKATAWLVARSPYRGSVGDLESHLTKSADSTALSASLLAAHVRAAMQAWHEWPWAREVDSDTFLRFVLPYRMTTEELEDWRTYFLAQQDLVDNVRRLAEEYRASSDREAVFRRLIHYMNSEWLAKRMRYAPRGMPDLPPSRAIAQGTGRCTDLANALIALCRTFGVAATGVRTIWWPKQESNHYWAGIWDPVARTWYDVDGASAAPLDEAYFHIQHGGCHAKVYRVVPGEERGAVARAVEPREGEAIPPLLDWYCRCLPMVDVTREYTTVATVRRGGLVAGRLYGLAVFNNSGLQEVCAARAGPDGAVTFADVGAGDILYFVTDFVPKEDRLRQRLDGAPFVVRPDGKVIDLASQPTFDTSVQIEGLPAGKDLVVRCIGPTSWVEVGHGRTDASGRLTLARVPRQAVLVAFDAQGRPIGRPMVLFDRLERF